MARAVGGGDKSHFIDTIYRGLRLTAVVTVPAALGLALLAQPILTVLFQWGEFGEGEVKAGSKFY